MTKIYAVSTGSYSDYYIKAMFSTREKAERFKAECAKEDYDDTNEIEEWVIDLYDDCVYREIYTIIESVGYGDKLGPYDTPYPQEESYKTSDFLYDAEIRFNYDYKDMIFSLDISAISKQLAQELHTLYSPWLETVRTPRIDHITIKNGITTYERYHEGVYVPCNL